MAQSGIYTYRAACYCAGCGELIRDDLTAQGKAPLDPDDEWAYDSGDFPKGPDHPAYHESDVPEHCDKCGMFLENALTEDGYAYVGEAIAEAEVLTTTLLEWRDFYTT